MTLVKKQSTLFLIAILAIGGFLRFYKLDWGQGLFTHPDEYHIAASVNQLSFPNQMHPHFFSYGTVIIYLIYFTQELLKYISTILNSQLSTFNSFIVGRFYSALFSSLTILIVYKISTTFFIKRQFSLIAAFLVAVTPGLIQQAHFATPESTLTFFLFGSLLFAIKYLKFKKTFYLILSSIFLGLALGVKVSSIVFLLPLIVVIIIPSLKKPLALIEGFFLSLVTIFTTFALSAPFVFIDYPAFRSNLDYEGGLAIGKIPVFYTRQFIDTIPVLFQIEKIFPYALGPALLIACIVGFFVTLIRLRGVPRAQHHLGGDRKGSSEVNVLFVVIVAFLSLFLANAFLFAKWTRFIAPTFPFFAIFAAYLLEKLTNKMRILSYSLTFILLLSTMLWTIAFYSIYTNPDIRITASDWLLSHAKEGSTFLVEGGNTIDIPLGSNFQRISLDFYPLEQDSLTRERIADALYGSDYFLVQSRRVFMNHQRLPRLYPKTVKFYDSLFDGSLGFEQVKTFHSYPKLEIGNWKLEIPDENAEETWSVFDHPVIRIFKKRVQLTKQEYARFLEN